MHERNNGQTADDARRLAALKWLSIARQATVDRETVTAYVVGLRDLPPHAVEQACQDIGNTQRDREERETAWPELGAIRTRAEAILRVERERAESRRLLAAPPQKPVDPEKFRHFQADVQREIARKRMR